MTVVDASALVAILLEEPEAKEFREFLLRRPGCRLSPVGYWEAAMRLGNLRGQRGLDELETVLNELRIEIAPATERTARTASEAGRAYGRTTPAGLNLGDCFAYALAKETGAPLLFKGDDFPQTDIGIALPG